MKKFLILTVVLFLPLALASSQVTDWRIVKGPSYVQTANNTPPVAASEHTVCCVVNTVNAGDATAVTISGGGIAGSMAFSQDGSEWFLDTDWPSEAAMDAVFPSSSTFTITLSGGTLVQSALLGTKAYPNVIYLTGTGFTDASSVNSSQDYSPI